MASASDRPHRGRSRVRHSRNRTACGVAALASIALLAGSPAQAHAAATSCRASAVRVSGPLGVSYEPVVANTSATPCATQAEQLAGAQSAGALTVTNPRASTESASGRLSASASIDGIGISGLVPVAVEHVSVTQVQSCTAGVSTASGSSSVAGLRIAGMLVLAGIEYVLGEASASGEACSAPSAAGGGGEAGMGSGTGTGSGSGPESGVLGGTAGARHAASRLALECQRRPLTLIDVLMRRNHVAVLGAAEERLIGRRVSITLLAGHRLVARAVVGSDGLFAASTPLPARRLRFTNAARYQASVGAARSQSLKLTRRMTFESIASRAGVLSIHGRVSLPLAQPIAPILIRRRLSCSSSVIVRRIRPSRNGTFAATLPVPPGTPAAVYVASTRVRQTARRRTTYPTFTLPRVVVLQ